MNYPKRISRFISSSIVVAGAIVLSPTPSFAAGPSISNVYPASVTANVATTLSATIRSSATIASCRLYVDLADLGEMTVSGNTASKPYTFASGGSHIAFVFCKDVNGGMSSGANTAIWVAGAISQITPFSGSTEPAQSFPNAVQKATPVTPTTVTPSPNVPVTTSTQNPQATTSPSPLNMPPKGSLIKLQCPEGAIVGHACHVVYYYGQDGLRHAFPNSRIYFTWYANFDTVLSVDASVLGAIPLGKNVTYRPAVRMVKFQTLNRVYAVSKGGVLRWIATEEVARSLYGNDWNKKIDDLSDTFYVNYSFGTDIITPSEYSTSAEKEGAPTIDASL